MSDRPDDSQVERVPEPTTEAMHDTDHTSADQPIDPPTTPEDPRPLPPPPSWAVPPAAPTEPTPASESPSAAPTWPGVPTAAAPTVGEAGANPWAAPPTGMFAGTPDYQSPTPPGPPRSSGEQRGRGWFLVAVVAALIGAAVGAGVTALADNHNNANSTNITSIKEGNASPGAALDGGTSIPKLVNKLLPAVVSIDVQTSQEEDEGSGMIISSNGMVVTNYHVIALAAEGGGTLTVTEAGSTSAHKATLVGTDQTDDVALLHISGASNLKTVTFGDSDKAVVGDAVVAIGNALGLSQGSPTVTQGIVSATGRTVTAGDTGTGTETLSDLLQTDAAINPGNSGGPLVDTEGEVIGMNTAVAGTTSDGTNAQNIGFAIPSAQIESLLPTLEKGGTPTKTPGYIGVDVESVTPQLRSEYGLTPSSGAVILSIVQGSPAAQAGLRQEDVIVKIGSTAITSAADLQSAVQNDKAGQTISLTFYRGAKQHTVSLTLISQTAIQNLENGLGSGGLGGSFGGATTP
jgi:S1-C subfamily serine protease